MKSFLHLAVLVGLVYGQCNQNNCKLPDCRCYKDDTIPGGLAPAEVPQMVVITMDYALNSEYEPLYSELFESNNPNDCPAVGTFFIQDLNTDYKVVENFYNKGFEIGVSSLDGTVPKEETEWIDMIGKVKGNITSKGNANGNDVLGFRPPMLDFGGTNEFIGIGDNGLLYDAGCITNEFVNEGNYKWPYTYDFAEGAECSGQSGPVDKEFKGKWEVLIPSFRFKDQICEVPQGCTNVQTKQDVFDMLYDNFVGHFEGNRTPYYLIIDAAWIKDETKRGGTKEFVEYLRAAFEDDVYLVTVFQSLQWIQDPTPIANLTDFAPWSC